MTDPTNRTAPAGWYPDPAGSADERYWDGASWTAQLRPAAQAASSAASASSAATSAASAAATSATPAAVAYGASGEPGQHENREHAIEATERAEPEHAEPEHVAPASPAPVSEPAPRYGERIAQDPTASVSAGSGSPAAPSAPQPGGYGSAQPGGYGSAQPGGYGSDQPGGYGSAQPGGYGTPQNPAYGTPQAGPGNGASAYGPTPTGPAYGADASGQYRTPSYPPAPQLPPRAPEGTKPNTPFIWAIAVLPLISLIAFASWDLRGYYTRIFASLEQTPTNPVLPDAGSAVVSLLGFVVYFVAVLLAFFDWRALKARGVVRPFHWAWTFLGAMVYMIGRTVIVKRRTGRGLAPLFVYLGIVAVYLIVVLVKVADAATVVLQYMDSSGLS